MHARLVINRNQEDSTIGPSRPRVPNVTWIECTSPSNIPENAFAVTSCTGVTQFIGREGTRGVCGPVLPGRGLLALANENVEFKTSFRVLVISEEWLEWMPTFATEGISQSKMPLPCGVWERQNAFIGKTSDERIGMVMKVTNNERICHVPDKNGDITQHKSYELLCLRKEVRK